jgi:hypothetical protein
MLLQYQIDLIKIRSPAPLSGGLQHPRRISQAHILTYAFQG